VVQIARHVPNESGVDNLLAGVVLDESEHIASKVEFLLPDVGHGFTDNFPYILHHDRMSFGEISNEQAQPIYFGGSDVNVIIRLFDWEVVLFLYHNAAAPFVQILFYVLEGNEWHNFGLHHRIFIIGWAVSFFQVEQLLLCHVVLVFYGKSLLLGVQSEVPLSLPLVFIVYFQHFPFPLLPVEGIERGGL
jgi:hypothetical protein